MAYHLQSLLHTIEQILHPDSQLCVSDLETILLQTLKEKTTTLKQILENLLPPSYKRAESLVSQIADATHKAECIIDYAILGQIPSESTCTLSYSERGKTTFRAYLERVTGEVDSMIHKAMTTMVELTPEGSSSGVSFTPDLNSGNTLVGLGKDIIQLKHCLTGWNRGLEIIPITGMGGIGKTTLAQNLYSDPLIACHFDCYAWATISQEYNMGAICSSLICCITRENANEKLQDQDQGKISKLQQKLYQTLVGRRYLIVLDDIWITRVWDELRRFFPDNNNGSRIIITTRELDVANYVNPSRLHHQMHFLDEAESWDLLVGKVFGKEECPRELEHIGRRIAINCKGLPLALQVISGLLSESEKTRIFWEHVGNDVSTAASSRDDHFSKILSLSYDLLPYHLRPCFLYIGAFPEENIKVSEIKRLWAAEGFLKLLGDKTLEEVAEEYLEALENRNLILVRESKSYKKVKSYGIHDLLRDLSRRKADQEKFIVQSLQVSMALNYQYWGERRVICIDRNLLSYEVSKSTSLLETIANSFSSREEIGAIYCSFNTSRYLRVWNRDDMNFSLIHDMRGGILLTNIRFLALGCTFVPSIISRLWNLETLIVYHLSERNFSTPVEVQFELCTLKKLRHFKIVRGKCCIGSRSSVMENLQTLDGIIVHEETIEGIPNIRKLGMKTCVDTVDLSNLHKLENLILSCIHTHLRCVTFSDSIKKLVLLRYYTDNDLLTTVCLLPNLEALKLQGYESISDDLSPTGGAVWETSEGGFLSLKFLELSHINLVQWRTDETHFPRLKHLVIKDCTCLEEIPQCIGDIPTMEIIEVFGCHQSLNESAILIQEEQMELENDTLQVRIVSKSDGSKRKVLQTEAWQMRVRKQGTIPVFGFPTLRSGECSDIGERSYMEDTHICIEDLAMNYGNTVCGDKAISFYGVFDGHGGKAAAQFVRDHLPRIIVEDADFPGELEKVVMRSYLETDVAFAKSCFAESSLSSGTTALTAMICGRSLLVANAGDCRAVLSRRGLAIEMSNDHRPYSLNERLRIESLGGFIEDGYLNGQLSVSRALGDWDIKGLKGENGSPLSAEPELELITLTIEDEFLIIASDGLWDVFRSQNAVDFARRKLQEHNNVQQCCKDIVMEAIKCGSFDNVTVVMVCFHSEPPPPTVVQRSRVRRSLNAKGLASKP